METGKFKKVREPKLYRSLQGGYLERSCRKGSEYIPVCMIFGKTIADFYFFFRDKSTE